MATPRRKVLERSVEVVAGLGAPPHGFRAPSGLSEQTLDLVATRIVYDSSLIADDVRLHRGPSGRRPRRPGRLRGLLAGPLVEVPVSWASTTDHFEPAPGASVR